MTYILVPQIPIKKIIIFFKDISFVIGEKSYLALALTLRKVDIFTVHSKPVVILCLQPHYKYIMFCMSMKQCINPA